ncbi:cysteine--tRNA ligase [Geoglobus acetivorans]|uniref:Cysteine--tRNA ligase n=1 Tax=Geoglobus acetivorans TaxID=565033 RepID=A0A0A7GET3_GEOAI|nr:Cysteinyl-tRNA synthetase [Geoglobus acetivorans]
MKLFDTMKKDLIELDLENEVRIYVCGITAYDYSHIGHARNVVIFDALRRYLEFRGHRVKIVQNFTDIDDKIISRAVNEGKKALEISNKFINEFLKDIEELNVKECIRPKVSEYIPQIIRAVEKLIEKGFAYTVRKENGYDVYFHVPAFESYGKLSGLSTQELERHRIEPDPQKKDKRDFALWKSAKEEDFRAESYFDSPWGPGRPGWHIECSIMSSDILGVPFDIHGGGMDLVFPHHENERAQSYALFDTEPVRYWIHNNFITVNGEKMSKSLGNIVKIRDVVEKYGGLALRYLLISAHYRHPLDYSEEKVIEAKKSYEYLLNSLRNADMEIAHIKTFQVGREGEEIPSLMDGFVEALENDFNTPRALAVMHELASNINSRQFSASLKSLEKAFDELYTMMDIMGLIKDYGRSPLLGEEDRAKIVEREEARRMKDFKTADMIRDEFKNRGIMLVDTKHGTRWYLA